MPVFTLPPELFREVAQYLKPHDRTQLRLTHPRFSQTIPPSPAASEALQQRAEEAAKFPLFPRFGFGGGNFGTYVRDVFTNREYHIPTCVRPGLPLVLSPTERRRQTLEPIPAFKRVVIAFERLPEVAQHLAQAQKVDLSLHEELDYLAACRIRARAELGNFESFFNSYMYERHGREEIDAVRRWTSAVLHTRDEPLLAAMHLPLYPHVPPRPGDAANPRFVQDLRDPAADEHQTIDYWLERLAERHSDRDYQFAPLCKDALTEARQSGLLLGLVVRAGLYEFQRRTSPEARKFLAERVVATVERMAAPASDFAVINIFKGLSFQRTKDQYFREIFAEADLAPDSRARSIALTQERPLVDLQKAYAEVFKKAIQLPDVRSTVSQSLQIQPI